MKVFLFLRGKLLLKFWLLVFTLVSPEFLSAREDLPSLSGSHNTVQDAVMKRAGSQEISITDFSKQSQLCQDFEDIYKREPIPFVAPDVASHAYEDIQPHLFGCGRVEATFRYSNDRPWLVGSGGYRMWKNTDQPDLAILYVGDWEWHIDKIPSYLSKQPKYAAYLLVNKNCQSLHQLSASSSSVSSWTGIVNIGNATALVSVSDLNLSVKFPANQNTCLYKIAKKDLVTKSPQKVVDNEEFTKAFSESDPIKLYEDATSSSRKYTEEQRAKLLEKSALGGNASAISRLIDKKLGSKTSSFAEREELLKLIDKIIEKKPKILVPQNEKILRYCVEAGPVDEKKYSQLKTVADEIYQGLDVGLGGVEYAEYATNPEFSGMPDMQLALQIMCKDGLASSSMGHVALGIITNLYYAWKTKRHMVVDVCGVMSSKSGAEFCLIRRKKLQEKELKNSNYPKVVDRVWLINGKKVMPTCLAGGKTKDDVFRRYLKKYPQASEFRTYPGKYWLNKVPLTPTTLFDESVMIPQKLSECNEIPSNGILKENKNIIAIFVPEDYQNGGPASYRLLAEWGPDVCEKLMPDFAGNCHSVVYVNQQEGDVFFEAGMTFAHVVHEEEDYILPVTRRVGLLDFLKIIQ